MNATPQFKLSVTNILILTYIGAFLFSMIGGTNYTNVQFGLNARAVLSWYQYYRVVTSAFLHVNLIHLLMNSYFIYIIGHIIEDILGKWRYIILVFFTIITSSIVVILADVLRNQDTITVGASGFGYGLIGCIAGFAIMYPKRYYVKMFQNLIINIGIFAALSFFYRMNISWEGHLGGFIGGMLITAILAIVAPKETW